MKTIKGSETAYLRSRFLNDFNENGRFLADWEDSKKDCEKCGNPLMLMDIHGRLWCSNCAGAGRVQRRKIIDAKGAEKK